MNKNCSTASTNITILLLAIILLVGCTFPNQTDSPTQIPTAPGNRIVTEFTPALSNLSGQVVYTAFVDREPLVKQIFLKDLETGEVTQLTHSGSNSMPKWSPNGSQIVYLSWSQENSYDIYIMNADGTDSQPLVTGTASDRLPDWSPLGDKIVFESDRDGTNQIYVLDLNSFETIKLTNGLPGVSLPNWSTDGQQIVFTANIGVSGRSQIFIVDADGTNLQQLTDYDINNFDGRPVWCPDDSCIIFTRFVSGVPKLMLLDLATNEISPLLKDVFADNLQETGIDRSPIRKFITFSVVGDFYAINFKTGELFSLGVTGLSLSLYP